MRNTGYAEALGFSADPADVLNLATEAGARISAMTPEDGFQESEGYALIEFDDPSGLCLRAVAQVEGRRVLRSVFTMFGFVAGEPRPVWINEYRSDPRDFLVADLSTRMGKGLAVFGLLDTESWIGRRRLSSEVEVRLGGFLQGAQTISSADRSPGVLMADGVHISFGTDDTAWWPLTGQEEIAAGALLEGPVGSITEVTVGLTGTAVKVLTFDGLDGAPVALCAPFNETLEVAEGDQVRSFVDLTGFVHRDLHPE